MFRRFLSRYGAGRSKPRQIDRPRPWGRRGFSIVEAMVAMAVIAIVTAVAITIVLSSLRIAQKTADREKAEYFSADTIEAFRISDDVTEFVSVMGFAGYPLTKDGSGSYTYQFQSGYEAAIAVDYTLPRPALTVTVKDQDGGEVSSYTFTRGG